MKKETISLKLLSKVVNHTYTNTLTHHMYACIHTVLVCIQCNTHVQTSESILLMWLRLFVSECVCVCLSDNAFACQRMQFNLSVTLCGLILIQCVTNKSSPVTSNICNVLKLNWMTRILFWKNVQPQKNVFKWHLWASRPRIPTVMCHGHFRMHDWHFLNSLNVR